MMNYLQKNWVLVRDPLSGWIEQNIEVNNLVPRSQMSLTAQDALLLVIQNVSSRKWMMELINHLYAKKANCLLAHEIETSV